MTVSLPTRSAARTSSQPKHRTIGPVSDLEQHLPDEWWKVLFNALYLKTDGDVVENEEGTAADIDLILEASGLTRQDAILDLCCGQGRHLMELAGRGFSDLTGIDRSRYLIRLAKRRAKAKGFPISFKEGDARQVRLPADHFSAITVLGNSFGYFTSEEDDGRVLGHISRLLKSEGLLIMDLCDGAWMKSSFSPRSWEWIDDHHFVCRERSLSKDGDRLISREVITHTERGVIVDQFYAERLYDEERLRQLLESFGFTDIRIERPFVTRSDRGQDLGMLEARLLVLAKGATKDVRVSSEVANRLGVTVLLGDPRLADPVKVNGQFNPEDHETVRKMKEALATLPGYDVSYIDDHSQMIAHLQSTRPDLVLNLCDEGFQNDPLKELHVAALLEMFGHSYTGGAPATLAYCYDKSLVRAVANALDIPTPTESYVNAMDVGATLPSTFPAILKPNQGDSSVGITTNAVVHSMAEMVERMDFLRQSLPNADILVQEFLTGTEYSVGLIGNPGSGFRILPILEVDYSGLPEGLSPILGYESKWLPDSPYWTAIRYVEADLSSQDQELLTHYAKRLFDRLDCRDYARIDFRRDAQGTIRLLEVNPNPGWCWDGKMALMAEMDGLGYAEMLDLILRAAQERYEACAAEVHSAKHSA